MNEETKQDLIKAVEKGRVISKPFTPPSTSTISTISTREEIVNEKVVENENKVLDEVEKVEEEEDYEIKSNNLEEFENKIKLIIIELENENDKEKRNEEMRKLIKLSFKLLKLNGICFILSDWKISHEWYEIMKENKFKTHESLFTINYSFQYLKNQNQSNSKLFAVLGFKLEENEDFIFNWEENQKYLKGENKSNFDSIENFYPDKKLELMKEIISRFSNEKDFIFQFNSKLKEEIKNSSIQLKRKFINFKEKEYNLVSINWQKWIIKNLNLSNLEIIMEHEIKKYNKNLNKIEEIEMDGNCFYRSISFLIFGVEENWEKIKEEFFKFIENYEGKEFNEIIEMNEVSRGGSSVRNVKEYIKKYKRNKKGKWATEIEISFMSTFLQTSIVILNKFEFNPLFNLYGEKDNEILNEKIYLINENDNHFNVLI